MKSTDKVRMRQESSSRPYRKPTIRDYGRLADITQTAEGTVEDGGIDPFGFPQLSGLAG